MYEAHFGLAENPFGVSPDPRFLYLSEVHQEALAHLIYGIRQRRGFMVITGDVGTGKTTLLNRLLQELDARTHSAFITNPRLATEEFLRLVAHGLKLKAGETFSKAEFLIQLEALLAARARRGEAVLLVVDEAQNLSAELLEEIRLLSNLETAAEKMLQIILVGQQELNEKLLRAELRQLRQRVSIKYHLQPLGPEDTAGYIAHRLKVAGHSAGAIFSREAALEVWRASGGFPRLINNICDNALLGAYSRGLKRVDGQLVKETLMDIEASYPHQSPLPEPGPLQSAPPEPVPRRPQAGPTQELYGAAALLLLVLLLLALLARPALRPVERRAPPARSATVEDVDGKVR